MGTLSWGKPTLEIAAYISGAAPQKRYVLSKAVAIIDTTIEVLKGSGAAVGDVIGYNKKSLASTVVVTTDPLKDVITVTLGVVIPVGAILYEAAAASPTAAVEKATWIPCTPIKQDSTKLTTTKGTKTPATEEGGGLVDVRYDKNGYSLECELFVKRGWTRPIVDSDGVVIQNYMARLTPEDVTLEGFVMDKVSVQLEENFTAKDGKTIKYTFEGLVPATGDILKEYTAAQ